jgi:hypothetical protein
MHSDNGGEFLSEFDKVLKDNHIKHTFSLPHTP